MCTYLDQQLTPDKVWVGIGNYNTTTETELIPILVSNTHHQQLNYFSCTISNISMVGLCIATSIAQLGYLTIYDISVLFHVGLWHLWSMNSYVDTFRHWAVYPVFLVLKVDSLGKTLVWKFNTCMQMIIRTHVNLCNRYEAMNSSSGEINHHVFTSYNDNWRCKVYWPCAN